MLELPSTAATVQEARRLSKRTGDLFAQVSLESNLALGALDAGDLARAEALMDRARRMLGSADMQVNRFNQAYNLGELALAQSDFGRAIDAFGEAEQYINPTTPAYVSDFLNAGIGLCSLESGNLSEARRREEAMSHRSSSWRCDPTTILTFRVRLLARRNRCGEALAMLAEGAEDLDGRLVLAWLKVRALQVRLLRKVGDEHARILAAEAHERALSLNLTHRAATFAEVLKVTG
jgi:tetratricopeptide (TPR) repeat protein